jgi:hypothetical protein
MSRADASLRLMMSGMRYSTRTAGLSALRYSRHGERSPISVLARDDLEFARDGIEDGAHVGADASNDSNDSHSDQ